MPKYVPSNSLILTEQKYSLFQGIETMTSCSPVTTYDLFNPNKNYRSYIKSIKNLSIEFAVLDENEHLYLHPSISSFLDNFLIRYYFTKRTYQYQGLGIYEYNPVEIPLFHQASLDFMIYANGSNPREWGDEWTDLSNGDSKIQVIDEKQDHIKV